jgi:hypothetical protein
MKNLLLGLLLAACLAHADDSCTINFLTLYSTNFIMVTHNSDGSASIDDETAQAWAAYIIAVSMGVL